MSKLSQCEYMLKVMLTHPEHPVWTAKDFQHDPWFVGYEASARMSDLKRIWPELFIVGREDRFRTLQIDRLVAKEKGML